MSTSSSTTKGPGLGWCPAPGGDGLILNDLRENRVSRGVRGSLESASDWWIPPLFLPSLRGDPVAPPPLLVLRCELPAPSRPLLAVLALKTPAPWPEDQASVSGLVRLYRGDCIVRSCATRFRLASCGFAQKERFCSACRGEDNLWLMARQ